MDGSFDCPLTTLDLRLGQNVTIKRLVGFGSWVAVHLQSHNIITLAIGFKARGFPGWYGRNPMV